METHHPNQGLAHSRNACGPRQNLPANRNISVQKSKNRNDINVGPLQFIRLPWHFVAPTNIQHHRLPLHATQSHALHRLPNTVGAASALLGPPPCGRAAFTKLKSTPPLAPRIALPSPAPRPEHGHRLQHAWAARQDELHAQRHGHGRQGHARQPWRRRAHHAQRRVAPKIVPHPYPLPP